MVKYTLTKGGLANAVFGAVKVNQDTSITSFLFDPSNTDYQQFKKDVLEGAELQDADGNTLTQQEAEEFIKTLP